MMERNGEGGQENYGEVEKIQLIDFSAEDDILVDYPFRDSLEDLRLSVSFKDISEYNKSESLKMAKQRKVEDVGNSLHQREEILLTPELLQPTRPSYLRKSLAWDNAFFSSDGVLDPEELSAMNSGFKGPGSSLFPGLPEDLKMRRSFDSDLTFESLESDAFSLESYDGDLFEDVRASIHRSCGPLNLTSASCDSVIVTSNVPATKKSHVSTQNKGRSNATLREQTTKCQKSKTMTESSLPSQNLQHKGEYNLTPRILGAQNTISRQTQTKRASLVYGNRGNRTGNGQGPMVPKQSASLYSPSSINFLTPLTKSSSSPSTIKSSSVAGSSCDEFSSTASSRSILSSGKGNRGSNSSKIGSSGSNSKPPLRYSGRSRSRLSKETSSIHLLSMSHRSNNSPTSSIDGWSSESTSSTCSGTAKRRSGILEGRLRTDTDHASAMYQSTERKMSADQQVEGALRDASSVPIEPPNSLKPSGLRMPSPKIGFFDEDKSGMRSTDTFRFRSQSTSSDLNANAVKKRPGKLQPLRCVPGTKNSIGSPLTPGLHSTSITKPRRTTHSKQLDNASTKCTVMRYSLGPALKLRTDTTFQVDNAYCSKTRKVGKGEDDRKKIMLTSSLKTEEERNKGILKNKMGKEETCQRAGTGSGILLETVDPIKKDHEAARKLHSTCESKENFEDQVNGLSKYFEVIDLGGKEIELEGKKSNVFEQKESADGEHFLGGQQQDTPSIARIPLADKILAGHQPDC